MITMSDCSPRYPAPVPTTPQPCDHCPRLGVRYRYDGAGFYASGWKCEAIENLEGFLNFGGRLEDWN